MSVGGTCSVSGQMKLRGNFTTVTAGHKNGNTWQKKDSNREHVALSAAYFLLSMSRHFHCRQASSDFDVHALEPRLQKHGALDLIDWQIFRFTRAQNPKP